MVYDRDQDKGQASSSCAAGTDDMACAVFRRAAVGEWRASGWGKEGVI